mgnify:CR=1 FL=1
MAATFLNDLGANPWVLAEQGVASTKNVAVSTFSYQEADRPKHVAEIEDNDGRLVARLTPGQPIFHYYGWVKGLNVTRLDSGYVLASLRTE